MTRRVPQQLLCVAASVLCACEQENVQSDRDAIRLLCEAPSIASRVGVSTDAWVFENINNGAAVVMFAGYKSGAFAARQLLHDVARSRGIERCPLIEPDWSSISLPEVRGVVPPLANTLPLIIVGRTSISVAGHRVLDTKDVFVTGTLFVREVTEAIKASGAHAEPYAVAIDRDTPYGVFVKVLWSAAPAGLHRFVLSARKGSTHVGLPVDLPRRRPSSSSPPFLILSAEGKQLKLWSVDSSYGTSSNPAFTCDRSQIDALQRALAESISRRFGQAQRSDEQRVIVLMLPSATPAQEVLDLMSLVRSSPDREELYPVIDFFPVD